MLDASLRMASLAPSSLYNRWESRSHPRSPVTTQNAAMMRHNGLVEEAEEEDEEEFYESLDRIVSSSGSSTSASDDDAPSPLPSLHVWTSEPAPIAERRRVLLQRLGLAADPKLARLPPSPSAAEISRSRSDGSVEPSSVHAPDPPFRPYRHRHRRSINLPVSRSRASSAEILEVSDGGGGSGDRRWENGGDGRSRDDPRRLIKNLDNGREFVVKEFGKDGMCDKLRELATGRQLTMQEFEMCVGCSPIVQELMRRQNVEEAEAEWRGGYGFSSSQSGPPSDGVVTQSKKKRSWLRSLRTVAGAVMAGHHHHHDRRSSDEKETSSEKGGRRSSSATDDSQDGALPLDFRIKVWQYGKSHKELTGLCMSQAIQAHNGSIWTIKFSLDGRYLASAGEDRVIHVWEISYINTKVDLPKATEENGNFRRFAMAIANFPSDPRSVLAGAETNHWDKKRREKIPDCRKSNSADYVTMPEHVFALSEKPVCSFRGHVDDVLDLSWSKSKYLLSSSMDKTVRLWHFSSNSCLKTFTHSDYVTCIQFNPIDDRYFISGSLDEKVRIWSIPDRQIVDWNDLHEMVTAACYTPDGQGAVVGSHTGNCHRYSISVFSWELLKGVSHISDSRVRVLDGDGLVHKFKGFRNRSSQISAYWTTGGKYVICASEDSNVYIWRYDEDPQPGRTRTIATVTQSYEYFNCQGVTMAVPWPCSGMGRVVTIHSNEQNYLSEETQVNLPLKDKANRGHLSPSPGYLKTNQQQNNSILSPKSNHFCDRGSATWPEELMANKQSPQNRGSATWPEELMANKQSPQNYSDLFIGGCMPAQSTSSWGLVIVTASHGGKIRIFQNIDFQCQL